MSGVSEPIGGLIGYALLAAGGGANSPLMFAIAYGFVAGMMVFIGEWRVHANKQNKKCIINKI